MDKRYVCRVTDYQTDNKKYTKSCGYLYQDNKCRMGGYCSILETKVESFEIPINYRLKIDVIKTKPKGL